MRATRRVLAIAAFVGLLVAGWRFAAAHPQPVRIHYLVGETGELSLWAALLGAFLAGGALAGGLAGYQLARLGMLARRYRKAVARLEVEVHELRNLPLAPEAAGPGDAGPDAALGHASRRGG
jgi:uncharacterized integral membrane protein